jgi:hypothetical protein
MRGETVTDETKPRRRRLTVSVGVLLTCALILAGPTAQRALAQLDLSVFQKEGTSEEEQSKDRFECHRIAVQRTGVDPAIPPPDDHPPMRSEEKAGLKAKQAVEWRKQKLQYNEALRNCMKRRGYTIADH